MKEIELNIILDNLNAIYLSGEYITGKFYLKAKEKLKINGIKLIFSGSGKVRFFNENEKRVFNSIEEYTYSMINYMDNSNNDNDDLYLSLNDEHVFDFKFKLLNTLPSSFEHSFGYIRYTLDGVIDIPWSFDKHVKKIVTIINNFDLSSRVSLSERISACEINKSFSMCCKSNPITASIHIEKSGYVPGEFINFNVFIQNSSSRIIQHTRMSLIQIIEFNAYEKTKVVRRKACEIVYGKTINSYSLNEWKNGKLLIPPLITSISISKIIHISYILLLSLHYVTERRSNLNVRLPIEIGTMPIKMQNNKKQLDFRPCIFGPLNKHEGLEQINSGDTLNIDDFKNIVISYPFYDTHTDS